MCFIVAGNDTLGMENKHIRWFCYMVLSWGRGGLWSKRGLVGVLFFLNQKKHQIRKATCWCHFLNFSMQATSFKNQTKQRIPDDPYTALADNKSHESLMCLGNGNITRNLLPIYRTKRPTFLFHQLAGNMSKFYLAWSSVCHNNTTLHLFHSLPTLY